MGVPGPAAVGARGKLTFLGVAQGRPKLEVFLGQESRQFEIVSASAVAGKPARTIQIELRSGGEGPPSRVIEVEYTNPGRGLAVWSEPAKPRSPGVVLFQGRVTYGANEKLSLYRVRPIDCSGGDGT